jgi:hypothetical protein
MGIFDRYVTSQLCCSHLISHPWSDKPDSHRCFPPSTHRRTASLLPYALTMLLPLVACA